jgi:hypothetical protein
MMRKLSYVGAFGHTPHEALDQNLPSCRCPPRRTQAWAQSPIVTRRFLSG